MYLGILFSVFVFSQQYVGLLQYCAIYCMLYVATQENSLLFSDTQVHNHEGMLFICSLPLILLQIDHISLASYSAIYLGYSFLLVCSLIFMAFVLFDQNILSSIIMTQMIYCNHSHNQSGIYFLDSISPIYSVCALWTV